jgi:type IV secretory pathway VirB10-like protein
MLNKPFALVALAGLIAAGAGTGAYLAVRGNAADRAGESALADEIEPVSPAGEAVEATETILDQPAAETARTPEPVVQPAPASPPAPETIQPRRAPPTRAEQSARIEPAEPPRTDPRVAARAATSSRSSAAAAEPPVEPVVDEVPLAAWDERPIGAQVAAEPKPRVFEELIVSADSVIGLQLDTAVSTETARIEDPVEARVTRDVMVGSRVAIPAGSQVHGSVVLVEKGGKVKEVARLGVRFHTVIMEEGVEMPIVTETIYREGKSPGSESVAKIGGGAVGGAIIGAILGGARGAAIGGSVGAGAGTAAVMTGDPNPATFPAGTAVTVRLSQPATVTVEQ